MAWKDPEKQREAIRRHYYANREYYIQKAYRKRAAVREWLTDIKNKTPCTDCKIQYPSYVTDFDHIPEKGKKIKNISQLLNSGSFKKVQEEIAKCELVCANCHRARTFQRNSGNMV